jgi:hypothetical protein
MTNDDPNSWVREVLDGAVRDVEPTPGLDRIRARTSRRSRTRGWLMVAAGAAVGVAATVTAVAVVRAPDSDRGADHVSTTPTAPTPTTGTVAPPSPTATDTPVSRDSLGVPVYYLGEVRFHQGESGQMQTAFRLYREWHGVQGVSASSAATDVAAAALGEMLDQPATDPDYGSPWPTGVRVESVTHEGGVITVDLSGSVQEASVGAESAELAVQQLVYTVQGSLALMKDPNATDPVRILLDGKPATDLWGHVDISAPIARAQRTGTQAPIWITDPSDSQAVKSPVTVKGVAQVFEATVSWRVLRGGTEVDSGTTMASQGAPAFGDFSFTLDSLPAGDYVVEVFEASALDGSATFVDTKRFTVD